MDYDILVVGGGIAGMESALNLGDMGHKVLLVEKKPSIGGTMILLSKVFPTLDCSSCISTPKMAQTSHHPNITMLTSSEIKSIEKNENGTFKVRVLKKSTFVKNDLCTGCQKCEFACPVPVPDEYNFGLIARRAAYIPFPQAIPKKAVIQREGSSPCNYTCPGGVKPHGYIALTRAGKFEEAFHLHLEDQPLIGSLGRACYAPCESQCTRGELEGHLEIRRIKRFIADYYYEKHPVPEKQTVENKKNKKVAIVGSGPAGLTCAYHLAKKGYDVTVFEAQSKAGGMLQSAIPSFRLPKNIVERDILNITSLGVKIVTNSPVKSLKKLKASGYHAIFVATGTNVSRKMKIKGEELEGVYDCLGFLEKVNRGDNISFKNKKVVVIGGGNVAIDSARVARRLGAKEVIIQYRRTRNEMPAFEFEISEALEEGIKIQYLKTPVEFIGKNGKLEYVESVSMKLGEPDASGRRRPIPVEGSNERIKCDVAIVAIGLSPSTHFFKNELSLNRNGTIKVCEKTLQTSIPYVFAGGDAVSGPSMIINAAGLGKKAAFYIDKYLSGEKIENYEFDNRLPAVSKKEVLKRQRKYSKILPQKAEHAQSVEQRVLNFSETEKTFSEQQAQKEASRCLDCGVCSECHQCIKACPADAIDFSLRDEVLELTVGSVIVSTGFKLFDATLKPQYGFGKYKNVITAMQLDRLLSPTRPYNAVLRPSDGKVPDNIAFIFCTGSRDHKVSNPLCSRICCMYSIKQAQLLMGALPLADITIYYIDIRAFGKGYEEFYNQAKEMGVYFIKSRVAKIEEIEEGNLKLYYEDLENEGVVETAEHDLVVLSVGLLPDISIFKIFKNRKLEHDEFLFVKEPDEVLEPSRTSIPGVFVAGTSSGIMDIPDTILHSGAASAQASSYIEKLRSMK